MPIRLDERFVVHAPAGAVWQFLVDPRRVVSCVPGGELVAVHDARTFDGRVRVAAGPFTFAYGGRVRLADVDEAARRVRIVGSARESAGDDVARMTLESALSERNGATEVEARARIDVEGRIVDAGRRVLEELGHAVFQDFAARVAQSVEREAAARAAGAPLPPDAPGTPLRAVPLVARALRAWVAGWFARAPPHAR